jgi:hypothetical protein
MKLLPIGQSRSVIKDGAYLSSAMANLLKGKIPVDTNADMMLAGVKAAT